MILERSCSRIGMSSYTRKARANLIRRSQWSGWRLAWRSLTRTIHCPACGHLRKPGKACRNEECQGDIRDLKSALARLRFHDLRHHAITVLSEGQASDQTIMSIAGHVSQRMLAHYSHVRMEAKRQALDALASVSGRRSYDTKNDTKHDSRMNDAAEAIEKNGRHEETRTPDLYRVKVAL